MLVLQILPFLQISRVELKWVQSNLSTKTQNLKRFTLVNVQLMLFLQKKKGGGGVKSRTSVDANTRVVNVIGLAGLKQSVCREAPTGSCAVGLRTTQSVSG